MTSIFELIKGRAIELSEGIPGVPRAGRQRIYIDPTSHTPKIKDSTDTVSDLGGGGGGPDPFGWNPAHYVGTYAAEVTYAYGDAVRAFDDPDWKLYISAVSGNVGHNPAGDDGSYWIDTVAAATPVIVQGVADPNTVGYQADPLIEGGFATVNASLFLQLASDHSIVWKFNSGSAIWTMVEAVYVQTEMNNTTDKELDGSVNLERTGTGDGHVDVSRTGSRLDSGDGSSYGGWWVERGGTGEGNASIGSRAIVSGTAVGTADATLTASHHTGGDAKVGPYSDTDGALVFLGKPDAAGLKITNLPALTVASVADDVVANYNALRTALIAAGLATAG